MEENSELKRYKIKPIRKLTGEEIEYIATETTKKMETMITEFNGEYMYKKIKEAKIYLADIPNKFTKVNYIVSANSIYIRGEEDIEQIDEVMFHEIFHYIQCNKENNESGMPSRMGLCRFGSYNIKGLALNEAAIQLIISMVFDNKQENNQYFGIQIKSIRNKYFPILCALLQQIVYVIGHMPLLTSILENSDDFEIAFEKFAGKNAYSFLLESFDKMMKARDEIVEKNRIINNKYLDKRKKKILEKEIEIYVKEIQNHFLAIQKLCYTEYFNPIFKKVKDRKGVNELKKEIERYHEHSGIINEKDDFMIYIQKQMRKIDKKIKK